MRPAGREPGEMVEVEGLAVLPCEASERLVVAGDPRQPDFRMVEGEVDDGDAVPYESLDEPVRLRVAAQGDERAVAAPAARKAREAVDDREVPSVRAREPGDALDALGIRRLDHEEDVALLHWRNYSKTAADRYGCDTIPLPLLPVAVRLFAPRLSPIGRALTAAGPRGSVCSLSMTCDFGSESCPKT